MWDSIPLQNTGATSIYHALQISLNRRMSGGLLIAGSYVWSKAEEEGETRQNSVVTSQANTPRQLQFGLKALW